MSALADFFKIQGAVEALTEGGEPTSYAVVARKLGLDKATALRRVRVAIEKGYVRNLEDRRGREARLVIAEPLPNDTKVLPLLEDLQGYMVAQGCRENATAKTQPSQQDDSNGCRVAANLEGISIPNSLAISKCVECGMGFKTNPEYEMEAESLCPLCAADRVILNAKVI